jgi:N utilization substance protein A
VIAELSGEKIDIIEWNEDPTVFVTNALSPAKPTKVEVDRETKVASVSIASDQLSLAIGRGGQNVRLAARLTGWKINIVEAVGAQKEEVATEEVSAAGTEEAPTEEKPAEQSPVA